MTENCSGCGGEIIGMFELLDALQEAIEASTADRRMALAKTIDAYSESCPEEFYWATGPQSPVLLHHLIFAIDRACRVGSQKPRTMPRLVDRKPEGSA